MLPKNLGIWVFLLSIFVLQLSQLQRNFYNNSGISKTLTPCTANSDCGSQYYCVESHCEHESIFGNYIFRDICGIIMLFILSIGACMAGIGGGVFNVPIGLVIFQMDAHDAVPFSITVVTGVMLYRVITQILKKQKHPFKNQSIINYDISCLFAPSICLGTQIGVIVNKILPSWIILICYIIVMSYNFFVTKKKYHKQVQKEQNDKGQKLIENNEQEMENLSKNQEQQQKNISDNQTRIEEIKQLDARNIKWDRILLIALSIATMLIIDLLKGSSNIPSILHIKPCSGLWWLISLVYIPFGLYYVSLIYKHYLKESEEKNQLKIKVNENDFKYDKDLVTRINILGVTVGTISAMLGIGGGVIVAPVLLQLGLEPSESSATTSFVTLFTSLMNLIKYMMIGSITWDYAICACLVGCVGFYIGLKCIQKVTKSNKQSLIILSLLSIIFLASCMVIYQGVTKMIKNVEQGVNIFKFQPVCKQ